MVLVHDTGAQIAVEAKLVLNPKVLCQICDRYSAHHRPGPDFRAVLVGKVSNMDLMDLAKLLRITVIVLGQNGRSVSYYGGNSTSKSRYWSQPKLPDVHPMKERDWAGLPYWWDNAPIERLKLPEYVPDVIAGDKSPVVMGDWKIKAMKVCVWVERQKVITRQNFKSLKIDPSRWMTGDWLERGAKRGEWVAGPYFPAESYRNSHPTVYAQIEADFEKWASSSGLI
jgi:hypothetical protein